MSKKLNPELKPGDRIVIIELLGEPQLSFGDRGTVTKIQNAAFTQYVVKWDNGSSLYLLDEDKWMYESEYDEMRERKMKKNIQENKSTDLTLHAMLVKHFNMLYLKKYLNKLRESSVVNMLAAAPYLYIGKERLAHEHKYNDTNEAFDELVEMADKAQGEMVNGVISILEDENKEVTVERINSSLRRYAPKIISFYSNYF
jgi:wyosine [tRNA(Phe)-imidazoG37] synthetase (radical SAM superfamily)